MKKKIKESPDWIYLPQKNGVPTKTIWTVSGNRAFGYYNGKMYVAGDDGVTHGSLEDKYDDLYGSGIGRSDFIYPGRFWISKKIISFWKYPPKSKMKKVIADIEKELKTKWGQSIKIWNDYKVETIVDNQGKINKGDKNWDPEDYKQKGRESRSSSDDKWHIEFVPLKDYGGSKKRSKKDLAAAHALSPALKKKKEVPSGVGSKKYGKEKPLSYRYKLRKGLGDGVIKLSTLIESSRNDNSKPIGKPRGKFPYMKTDGVTDLPKSWESKLIYWRKMIDKLIGYEVLE